jgi:hypothetical protein
VQIRKRIGRSPGKAVAAVMALAEGGTAIRRSLARSRQAKLPEFAKIRSAPLDRRRASPQRERHG